MHAYLGVTVLVKLLVSEVGVQLHLVDCWLDLGTLQQVLNLLDTEVGDTNALHQTLLNKLLHLLPRVLCVQSRSQRLCEDRLQWQWPGRDKKTTARRKCYIALSCRLLKLQSSQVDATLNQCNKRLLLQTWKETDLVLQSWLKLLQQRKLATFSWCNEQIRSEDKHIQTFIEGVRAGPLC